MIYYPGTVFNVAAALGTAFIATLIKAAADFVAGTNQPWTYYTGQLFGYAALATGIQGAAATMYAVGDTVDALLFKSPDGSDVRIFLNGVATVSIDTYAAAEGWELVNIAGLIGGQRNRIDFVNYGPSANANATGVLMMGLGSITVNGSGAYAQESEIVAYDRINFRVKDSESDTKEATYWVNIPTGHTVAEIQAYANAIAPEVDALTGGKLMSADVTLALTLPGGLKATPVAGILNERGGLITFDTTGVRAQSVRIPAMDTDIMPGDSFSLAENHVAALITRLTTATTAANIRPVADDGYQFVTAVGAKKSFRRK